MLQSIRRHYTPGFKIQRIKNTLNNIGSNTSTWITIQTISGTLDDGNAGRGSIEIIAGQPTPKSTFIFFCDITDVVEGDRLEYKGKYYNVISAVDPQQKGYFLKLGLELIDNGKL